MRYIQNGEVLLKNGRMIHLLELNYVGIIKLILPFLVVKNWSGIIFIFKTQNFSHGDVENYSGVRDCDFSFPYFSCD